MEEKLLLILKEEECKRIGVQEGLEEVLARPDSEKKKATLNFSGKLFSHFSFSPTALRTSA